MQIEGTMDQADMMLRITAVNITADLYKENFSSMKDFLKDADELYQFLRQWDENKKDATVSPLRPVVN